MWTVSLTLSWFGDLSEVKEAVYYVRASDDFLHDKLIGFNALFQEFKRMSDLKAHMRYHTGNLLRCKDCGKGFPRMQQLRIHQV